LNIYVTFCSVCECIRSGYISDWEAQALSRGSTPVEPPRLSSRMTPVTSFLFVDSTRSMRMTSIIPSSTIKAWSMLYLSPVLATFRCRSYTSPFCTMCICSVGTTLSVAADLPLTALACPTPTNVSDALCPHSSACAEPTAAAITTFFTQASTVDAWSTVDAGAHVHCSTIEL
jgi:hypothetical protein